MQRGNERDWKMENCKFGGERERERENEIDNERDSKEKDREMDRIR